MNKKITQLHYNNAVDFCQVMSTQCQSWYSKDYHIVVGFVDRERHLEQNEQKQKKETQNIIKYLENLYKKCMKYIHCELIFLNTFDPETNTVIASGVWEGEGVFVKPRTFSNEAYDWLKINTTKEEYNKVYQWCMKKYGCGFDEMSTYASFIFPFRKRKPDTYWCAPYVVEALKEIGFFKFVEPNTFDPDDVYDYLNKSQRTSKMVTIHEKKKIKEKARSQFDKLWGIEK